MPRQAGSCLSSQTLSLCGEYMNATSCRASATKLAAVQAQCFGTAWPQIAGQHEPRSAEVRLQWLGRSASASPALCEQLVRVGLCFGVALRSLVGIAVQAPAKRGVRSLVREVGASRLQTRSAFVLPLRATQVSHSQCRSDGLRFELRGRLWPNSAVERTNNGGSSLSAYPRTAAVVCLSPTR